MKIDMVYLWCDGNEPEFKLRKELALGTHKNNNEEVVGDKRFFDCEELKYSLRSLEKLGVCHNLCPVLYHLCGLCYTILWFRFVIIYARCFTILWFKLIRIYGQEKVGAFANQTLDHFCF